MLDTPTPADEGAQVSFLAALPEEQRSKWLSAIKQVAEAKKIKVSILTTICEDLHSALVQVLRNQAPLASEHLTVPNMNLLKGVMDATGVAEMYAPQELSGRAGVPGYFFKFVCILAASIDFGGYRYALGLEPLPSPVTEKPKKK